MSFKYKIYGLQISSSRRISILPEADNLDTDLFVNWGTDAGNTPDEQLNWEQILTPDLKRRKGIKFYWAHTPEGVYTKLVYKTETGYMFFLLAPDKKQLWIVHNADEPANNLDSFFVGPVLGCMLRLRGALCLHASVVNIDGKAVGFIGEKRFGKSTTAAAFARLGYNVLSDDMAVVTVRDGIFYLESGYPKIRLRPASVAAFYPDSPIELPMVYSDRDSRYSNIEADFCAAATPLGAFYLLSKGDGHLEKPIVEPLSLQDILVALGKNTFGNYVITPDLRRQEFELLSKLALNVPVNRLKVVYDIKKVNLQCQAAIDNFRLLTPAAAI
ncbi:hypothetical protein BH09BAC6_BH09BAC6_10190 [soil metagenome]|jgi:hypothetical protein